MVLTRPERIALLRGGNVAALYEESRFHRRHSLPPKVYTTRLRPQQAKPASIRKPMTSNMPDSKTTEAHMIFSQVLRLKACNGKTLVRPLQNCFPPTEPLFSPLQKPCNMPCAPRPKPESPKVLKTRRPQTPKPQRVLRTLRP